MAKRGNMNSEMQSIDARMKHMERMMKGKSTKPAGWVEKLHQLQNPSLERIMPWVASVCDPWSFKAYIPDNAAYPTGLRTVRTTGTLASAANGDAQLLIVPTALKGTFSMSGRAGTATVDGTAHTSASNPVFDCHDQATLKTEVTSYRLVSAGLKLEYIGPRLNATGQCSVALLPPMGSTIALPIAQSQIADYTYSYIGYAIDGNSHVWLPATLSDFGAFDPDVAITAATGPSFAIGFSNLGNAQEVIRFELVQNVEVFSVNQMITPARGAGLGLYHPASLELQNHALRRIYDELPEFGHGHYGADEKGGAGAPESGFFKKAGRWVKRNVLPSVKTAFEVGEAVAPILGPLLL